LEFFIAIYLSIAFFQMSNLQSMLRLMPSTAQTTLSTAPKPQSKPWQVNRLNEG
jgi:hypothetical protein